MKMQEHKVSTMSKRQLYYQANNHRMMKQIRGGDLETYESNNDDLENTQTSSQTQIKKTSL